MYRSAPNMVPAIIPAARPDLGEGGKGGKWGYAADAPS